MNSSLQRIFGQLLPFIVIGIAIAFFIGLLLLFSYILIWGLLIGTVIWLTFVIKNYFFPAHPAPEEGRVIEHDDTE